MSRWNRNQSWKTQSSGWSAQAWWGRDGGYPDQQQERAPWQSSSTSEVGTSSGGNYQSRGRPTGRWPRWSGAGREGARDWDQRDPPVGVRDTTGGGEFGAGGTDSPPWRNQDRPEEDGAEEGDSGGLDLDAAPFGRNGDMWYSHTVAMIEARSFPTQPVPHIGDFRRLHLVIGLRTP